MPIEPNTYTMRNTIRAGRVNFAYYVQSQQRIQNSKQVGLNIYHPDNDVSILTNINVGAVNTTVSEYNRYIQQVQPVNNGPTITVPSPPTSLVATPGNTTASISFTPGSDGGSPITNYEYSTDGGATFTECNPPQTSSPVSITTLANGTPYDIQLKAVNNVGSSVASATVTTTPVTTPSPPTGLSATPQNLGASISFTPGNNGGSAITNYQYSINNGSTYTAFSPPQTSSPVSITGLTNGLSYNIKLTTVTVVGVSSASATVSVTPAAPASVPSPPTSLSSVGGNTAAYILFTPGNSGGSAITNYEYSTDGSTYTAFSPAQTFSPVAITGLTNDESYTIYLKAVNTIGSSIASSSVSVTPTVNTLKTSNLILELDANNSSSYNGSGTTWTNLQSGGSYSGTLTNGPTFDSGANTFTFDGTSQYVQIADAAAIRATIGGAITAQIWANVSSSGLTGSDGLISKQYGATGGYDGFSLSLNTNGSLYLKMNGASVDGTYNSDVGVYNTNVWALYTIVVRFGGGSGNPSYTYVSTRRVVTGINNEGSIPNNNAPLQLARGIQEGGNFAPCQIGAFYYYNTTVSQEDIIRNYDATKSRYGL